MSAAQVAELGAGAALLDGDRRVFGGVTVAGVSGVVGDPARALRRTEKDFLGLIGKVATPGLTLCGHVHGDEPVAKLGDGHVVKVDARVVVFTF